MADLTDYADAAKRLHGIQGNIAADVWPNGAILTCSRCGDIKRITAAQCGAYLAHGWPKCCGYTMTLTRKTEK